MPHILVVDDDPALRSLIELILTGSGYTVTCAANGREGLVACRRDLPAVVLTDMVMPELDGVGLIQAARREFPSLVFVAMSGGHPASDDFLHAARLAGASDTLPKPFSLEQLRFVIQGALSWRSVAEATAEGESATPFASCAIA